MSKDFFLTPEMIGFIISSHKAHLSMPKIAVAMQNKFGCRKFSRSTIKKILNKNNIDTSKEAVRIKKVCFTCGKEFSITRSRLFANKSIHNFCKRTCYDEWLKKGNYKESKKGSNIARKIIQSFVGSIPRGAITHHIDGDQNNNDIRNLILLKSQADHIKLHRKTGDVIPLFVGADISLPTSTANRKYNSVLANVIDELEAWDKLPATKSEIEAMTLSIASAVRYAMSHLKHLCGPGAIRYAFLNAVSDLKDRHTLETIFNDQRTYLFSKNI